MGKDELNTQRFNLEHLEVDKRRVYVAPKLILLGDEETQNRPGPGFDAGGSSGFNHS